MNYNKINIAKYIFDNEYKRQDTLQIIEQFYNFVIILKMIGIPSVDYPYNFNDLEELFKRAQQEYQDFDQLISKPVGIIGKLVEFTTSPKNQGIIQVCLHNQLNQKTFIPIIVEVTVPDWHSIKQLTGKILIFTKLEINVGQQNRISFALNSYQGKVYIVETPNTNQTLSYIGEFITYQFSKLRLPLDMFGYHQQKQFLKNQQQPLKLQEIRAYHQEVQRIRKTKIDKKYPKRVHILFGVIYSMTQPKILSYNGIDYHKVSICLIDPVKRNQQSQIGCMNLDVLSKLGNQNKFLQKGRMYMFRQTQILQNTKSRGYKIQYILFILNPLDARKIIQLSRQQYSCQLPYYAKNLAVSDMSTYYKGVVDQNIKKLKVSLLYVQYVSGSFTCVKCGHNIARSSQKQKFNVFTKCSNKDCESMQLRLSLKARALCEDEFAMGIFSFDHAQTIDFFQLDSKQLYVIEQYLFQNQLQNQKLSNQFPLAEYQKITPIFKRFLEKNVEEESKTKKIINTLFRFKAIGPKNVVGYSCIRQTINPNQFYNQEMKKQKQEQIFYNGIVKSSIRYIQSEKSGSIQEKKCCNVFFKVLGVSNEKQQFNRQLKPLQCQCNRLR